LDTNKNLTEAKKRRLFFYTEARDAEFYDLTAELHTPQYKLLHNTLLQLVAYHFGIPSGIPTESIDSFILDIGSGTGAEALGLLINFPRCKVVAVDLCESMHRILRSKGEKLLGRDDFHARCQLITADILGDEAKPEILRAPLRGKEKSGGYQIVVSALALHHLTHIEIEEVYRRIYSLLEPGGLFLNGDLFSFQSTDINAQVEHFVINWIDRQFTSPDTAFVHAVESLGNRRDEIRRSWLDHLKNQNIPIPIESAHDAFHPECGYYGILSHTELLQRIGFREIGCPFRFWQTGILWAKK